MAGKEIERTGLYSALTEPPLDTVSSFGPVVTKKTSINGTEVSGGDPKTAGFAALVLCGEG